MTVPIAYEIRRKLSRLQPGQTLTIGVLTVQLIVSETTIHWVIRSTGTVQSFRFPRCQGHGLMARVEVGAYILGHYQGEGFVDRRKWRVA